MLNHRFEIMQHRHQTSPRFYTATKLPAKEDGDFLQIEKAFVTLQNGNGEWILFEVDFKGHCIRLFTGGDQQGELTAVEIDTITGWFHNVVETLELAFSIDGWKFERAVTPIISNTVRDSGIFVILCADLHSCDLPLQFGDEVIGFFRKQICKYLLLGRLNY